MNTLEISGRTQSFSSTNSYITLPKQTYRILSPWYIYALSIAFFIAGFIFLGLGIKELVKGEKINYHNFIIFVVLVLISCIVSYFFPFYSSITIDMANNAITVKKYKLFFIIKKVKQFDTREIERAYTEINYSSDDDKNGEKSEDGFNLIFELKNGEKIKALEGESDKNFEMIKIGYFMQKFFPGLSEANKDESIGSLNE